MQSLTLRADQEAMFLDSMQKSYKKVFSLAYKLAGNRTDAEDLTQEAFYRAYRNYSTFHGDRPFENWIYRIVTRLFLDLKRVRKRRAPTVSSDNPLFPDGTDATVYFDKSDGGPDPEQQLLNKELGARMEWSMRQLTKEQRDLIELADLKGVSYKEIAQKFNAPVGTIRSRIHRAHKALKSWFEQYGCSNQCSTGCMCS